MSDVRGILLKKHAVWIFSICRNGASVSFCLSVYYKQMNNYYSKTTNKWRMIISKRKLNTEFDDYADYIW